MVMERVRVRTRVEGEGECVCEGHVCMHARMCASCMSYYLEPVQEAILEGECVCMHAVCMSYVE